VVQNCTTGWYRIAHPRCNSVPPAPARDAILYHPLKSPYTVHKTASPVQRRAKLPSRAKPSETPFPTIARVKLASSSSAHKSNASSLSSYLTNRARRASKPSSHLESFDASAAPFPFLLSVARSHLEGLTASHLGGPTAARASFVEATPTTLETFDRTGGP
jgi:hypothetical protein